MEFVLVLVTIGLIMVTLPNGRNIYKVQVNVRQSIYIAISTRLFRIDVIMSSSRKWQQTDQMSELEYISFQNRSWWSKKNQAWWTSVLDSPLLCQVITLSSDHHHQHQAHHHFHDHIRCLRVFIWHILACILQHGQLNFMNKLLIFVLTCAPRPSWSCGCFFERPSSNSSPILSSKASALRDSHTS